MYIITNLKRIVAMGEKLDYMGNGYPRLVNENVAFPPNDFDVHEVELVPSEVVPEKYCYTEAEGFYLNPDYKEPNPYGISDETLQAIKDDTVAELIELGVL